MDKIYRVKSLEWLKENAFIDKYGDYWFYKSERDAYDDVGDIKSGHFIDLDDHPAESDIDLSDYDLEELDDLKWCCNIYTREKNPEYFL